MGNENQKVQKMTLIQYPRLGQTVYIIQTIKNNKLCKFLQIHQFIENQIVVTNWLKQINSIQKQIIQHLILIPIHYPFKQIGICGQQGILKIQVEYYTFDLQSEIKERKKKQIFYEEKQIWFLFYHLIDLACHFQKLGKKIGNLHPKNILLNENGQFKIISKYSFPFQLDNFQQKIQNISAKAYLAPEQTNEHHITSRIYSQQINPCLAQIFSLGILILTVAVLDMPNENQRMYKIHNSSKITLNNLYLEQKLLQLKQNYSSFLYEIIKSILTINPSQRKKASKIMQSLQPFKDRILKMQQFLPNLNKNISYQFSQLQIGNKNRNNQQNQQQNSRQLQQKYVSSQECEFVQKLNTKQKQEKLKRDQLQKVINFYNKYF